ncbi:MAG: TadE/TadG family type IV pilus assembly protein [Bacilli bacterium]|nr:TadE/TadG family type IV pilus assembly protein [Bacilli bacterium]MDD4643630.1 TadE/TadG family type IV pilus assembly protein [Bacilli bacterium]
MRSNKGQALLEFILILPIFLLFLLAIIDFGRIIYEKNRLEGVASDVVDLVNNGVLSDAEIENKLEEYYNMPLALMIERKEVNTIINISREIDVLTPGLGIAISDPYVVEVIRVINNE